MPTKSPNKKVTKKVVRTSKRPKVLGLKLTKSVISLYERGELRPNSWLTIGKNMIYISRDPGGRTYWVLSKIPRNSWPNFKWSDRNQSLSINSTKIVFQKPAKYEQAKKMFFAIKPAK